MLKNTFSCLQRCRWQYCSSFVQLLLRPKSAKFCKNLNLYGSRSSKVIDLGVNRKRICNFLLVINSNFGRIFYSFRDIDAFSFEIACFPTPPLFNAASRRNTLQYHHIIYTSLKSTFSGLQFCRTQYGSIFICLAVVAFQNRENAQNSDKIWPYSSSGSSKVIDLGVNRKRICNFLSVINSNFGSICYRFRDIDV